MGAFLKREIIGWWYIFLARRSLSAFKICLQRKALYVEMADRLFVVDTPFARELRKGYLLRIDSTNRRAAHYLDRINQYSAKGGQ